MTKITKNGIVMAARDKNQLAAFLNNGWEVAPEIKEEIPVSNDNGSYTKTEINRMSTAELQTLATKEGIAGAENMTGAELKKVLIEKFDL